MRSVVDSVDEHQGAILMRQIGDRANRVDRTKCVRCRTNCNEPGVPVDQGSQVVDVEQAGVRDHSCDSKLNASVSGNRLPRSDVRVVIELSDYDVVS